MINAIKRLLGMHVHEWGPYGDAYSKDFESTTPVVDERVVFDDWGDEVIEEFETGEVEVRRWTENYQDRVCTTCNLTHTRRI